MWLQTNKPKAKQDLVIKRKSMNCASEGKHSHEAQ